MSPIDANSFSFLILTLIRALLNKGDMCDPHSEAGPLFRLFLSPYYRWLAQRDLNLPPVSSSTQGQAIAHQRRADFCIALHNQAHNRPQTRWEWKIRRSRRVLRRSAAPACPAAPPRADASASAGRTTAAGTAASFLYPECPRRQ